MQFKAERIGILEGHGAAIYDLAEGEDDFVLLSASGDKFVASWDILKKEPMKFSIKSDQAIFSICYLSSVKELWMGDSAGGLRVIDLSKKEEIRYLTLHQKGIFKILEHKANQHVIVLGGDGLMSIWRRDDQKLLMQLPISQDKLRDAIIDEEGKRLFLACGDGMLRVFETDFYNEIDQVEAHSDGIQSLCFLPNGDVLTGGKDAYLRVWNRTSLKLTHEVAAHNFGIYALVLSPDKSMIASASRDKTLKIWDANKLDFPLRLDIKSEGHRHSVNTLYWSKEHDILCSAGDDSRIILWKVSMM